MRGSRPLIHDDLFLHLSTGKYVVEHGVVPTTDPFSFTRNGERWVSHEWGFGLLSFAIFAVTGFQGLLVLKASAVVAILLLLFTLMIKTVEADLHQLGPFLVALLAMGLWAIDDQLVLRASLFSSLLLLVLLHLLRWFDRKGSRVSMAAIALLFWVWGNLHGEVLFGLFVLGLATVESLLGRRATQRLPRGLFQADPGRPYLPLFWGSLLLTLVNPNGIEVLLYPFRLASFLFVGQVPLAMGHFSSTIPATMPAFYVLVATLLWSLLPLRRAATISLTQAVSVAAFLLLALLSHRFIFYFTLFSLPVIARLHRQRNGEGSFVVRSRWLRAALLGVTAIATATTSLIAWTRLPGAAVSRHFPVGTVRMLRQERVVGRPFNHQNYGGYLSWNLEIPVFWDGRNLLFASLMQELRETPLERVARDWQIDYLLLTEFEFTRLREQLSAAQWGLVYWDDFAALYLRRRQRFAPNLERNELRLLPPFGGVEGLNLLVQEPGRVTAARRELDQLLSIQPECQRALYLHGLISFYLGDDERAEAELRRAREIGPSDHVDSALARVLERRARASSRRPTGAETSAPGAD